MCVHHHHTPCLFALQAKAADGAGASAAGTTVAAGIKPRAHLHAEKAKALQQGSTEKQQPPQQQQQAAAGLRHLQDTAVAATALQQVESAALQLLKSKLNLSFPVTHPEQLLAGPKHAKCLKNVLLHPPRAAVYGSEVLSHGCVKEVLGFYADLAADSAKDFQLVAACAEVRYAACGVVLLPAQQHCSDAKNSTCQYVLADPSYL
jgi:hypothetical protein